MANGTIEVNLSINLFDLRKDLTTRIKRMEKDRIDNGEITIQEVENRVGSLVSHIVDYIEQNKNNGALNYEFFTGLGAKFYYSIYLNPKNGKTTKA